MRRKSCKAMRATSMLLSAAMIASLVPGASALAAERQEAVDTSVIYNVDCGDIDPTTAPSDGALGTRNSVTDQIYGKDAKTGYSWGIKDKAVGDGSNNGSCSAGGVSTAWTWPYEYAKTDQSSKLSTNRYTKNQYEKGIETRNISYGFELENGEYLLEVGFADPWNCSKSPSLYVNRGQDDEVLIKKNINVAGGETSVAANVKVTDGELTVDAIGTGADNLAINMTYISIKEGGANAILSSDASAIKLPKTAVSDIKLPTEGSAGSKISWKSDKPEVISDEGKVVRPGKGESDAVVTLTAELTYEGETKTKTFTVTVPAISSTSDLGEVVLDDVEITDDYFDEALELDVSNMLKLDADRLLAGFRETAAYASGMTDISKINAFMKNKSRYPGGWENGLIGGHILGHYMSALATATRNPGLSDEQRAKVRERLDYIIGSLKECQEMTKGTKYEGYLFGATLPDDSFKKDVDLQFDNVENGKANIFNQAWVPWYTMHKILAGLVDAYEVAGNDEALEVAENLGTWVADRANNWSDNTRSRVLSIEYGGMNDALYELYKVSNADNKEDFKAAAHQFDETNLFESVKADKTNILNGKHANTTIPKFLGALNRYMVDNNETEYLEYAEAFWQMVIDKHTYVTGGNSEDEHFGADNVLDDERTNANNETCNTYNMLKLSRKLFEITGEKKYADYYENTLINAIMSSQEHEHGMTMYFQPMATGYHKVYTTLDQNFWCCTGTGYENFTKLQDSIYFLSDNDLIVNLYIASKFKGDGYTVEQTGSLADSDTMTFKVDGNVKSDLRLRIPDWTDAEKVKVKFGDEEYAFKTDGGYIVIPGSKLASGTEFTVKLPMHIAAYNLQDGEDTYAFKYGPFVLSAELGTDNQTTGSHGMGVKVPTSKAVASDSIGITGAESVTDFISNIDKYLVKDAGSMRFTLKGTNVSYVFTPHYKQNEQNYGIYWKYFVDAEGRAADEVVSEKNTERLNRAKISAVEQVGRGQYENQYTLTDGTVYGLIDKNGTSIGEDAPKLTRRAAAGDSFSYALQALRGEDNYLLMTYPKSEDGNLIKISVGDTVIAQEKLDSSSAKVDNRTLAAADQDDYYQVLYKISKYTIDKYARNIKITENGKEETIPVIEIKFSAPSDSDSAKIAKSVALFRAYSSDNSLKAVTANGQNYAPDEKGKITIMASYDEELSLKFDLADNAGYMEFDGKAVDEKAEMKLKVENGASEHKIRVYAEDFETYKDYTLVITRDFEGLDLTDEVVKSFNFNGEAPDAIVKNLSKVSTPEYSYTDGVFDEALKMDGKWGLELLDDASVLGDDYSISVWVNPDAVGAEYDPIIAGGTFDPEYWLNLTTGGRIWSHDAKGYVNNKSTGAYKKGEWQNIVFTVEQEDDSSDYAKGRLYLNGALIQEGDVARDIMLQKKGGLYFGVNKWDAIYRGMVDDINLFNDTLSPEEVSAIASKVVNSDCMKVEKKTETPSGNETPDPADPTPETPDPAPETPDPAPTNPEPTAPVIETKKEVVGEYTVSYPAEITFINGKKAAFADGAVKITDAAGKEVSYKSIKIDKSTKTGQTTFKIVKPEISDHDAAKLIKKQKFAVTITAYKVTNADKVVVKANKKGKVTKVTVNGIRLKKNEYTGTAAELTFKGRFTGTWKAE